MDGVLSRGVVLWRWRLMVWISVLWRDDVGYILWSDCLGSLLFVFTDTYAHQMCPIHLMYLPKILPSFSRVFIYLFGCLLNILKKINCWLSGILTPQWHSICVINVCFIPFKLNYCTVILWPTSSSCYIWPLALHVLVYVMSIWAT